MPAHIRRNYGLEHKRQRQAWAIVVASGKVDCWRCGQPITTPAWDLGHRDGQPSHPEHRNCNRSAGAAYGNRLRRPSSQFLRG